MSNNMIMTGYLKIILGSMFSGKTTELIKEYNRHNSCDFKCCFINHKCDDRYGSGTDTTKTHNNYSIKNTLSTDTLSNLFETIDVNDYDVYFINEGQFFVDLYDCVDILVNKNKKKVYVCGLDGDFQRKKFGSILDIIPLCDDVIKIKALCVDCKTKEGIFTYRISSEKEQKVIGSHNYKSLCRICYNNYK